MTIFDVVRNALLAGFGVQEKVREFIDDLVKKGELSESQGAKLVKEWTEKADKSTSDLSKSISELVTKTLEKMNIPTKDDIETLNKKIQNLSVRIKKLEGIPEGSETEE
ncbi:ATP synthase subunit B [Dissulfurispira thermophila]|uniref:ATP synthase subunit B n=2 Tax=root TaxID=1 RepID=A0A7G1H1M7_9BACT|nr:phasin family protein [Dissulfurispira thermophila]BCB96528.1 ATP synthase subunit B [Dissulfurispira thermophila]